MSVVSSGGKKHKAKVYLHVYDLDAQTNSVAHSWGMGFYHSGTFLQEKLLIMVLSGSYNIIITGIEFYGTEFTFGQSGTFTHAPKMAGSMASEGAYTVQGLQC